MMGIDDAIAGVSSVVGKIIDKVFPDPVQAAQAKALLQSQEAQAELDQLKTSMSVMLAEAQSGDKWTSRARPSLMYVLYIMILASLPMGIVFAFAPVHADAIATGVQRFLVSIPKELWDLFTYCFLGYTASRGFEKIKGVAK